MEATCALQLVHDPRYEFSAPRYHDFTIEETRMDIEDAEYWFEMSRGYEASPHAESKIADVMDMSVATSGSMDPPPAGCAENAYPPEEDQENATVVSSCIEIPIGDVAPAGPTAKPTPLKEIPVNLVDCPPSVTHGSLSVKRPHSDAWKVGQAVTAPKNSMRTLTRYARDTVMKKMKTSIDKLMFRDDQAKKKQKLESGCLKQVSEIKEQTKALLTVPSEFQHWTDKRAQLRTGKENCNSALKGGRLASPFISLAEKVLRFQKRTPERFRNHPSQNEASIAALAQQKPVLKLTVPKEPEFETSHRVRPPRVKSSAEQEEEMLSKLPKFKARPVNKKILEAPTLPAIPKSNPQLPHFQEFHLRTMERALHHLCASSVSSSDTSVSDLKERRKSAPGHLAEPHEPQLHTAARARPIKVKSSEEMEMEELAKVPKFKARPLNKKIFESRGDLGIFRSHKRQLTVPMEFHFATEERFQHRADEHADHVLTEKFDKEAPLPAGPTVPEPFRLVTEHRGAAKEMKFMQELFEREIAERDMRIPKANPLPFTTDIPLIPLKPRAKDCTKPEPFELESLVRHEEELQRKAEELARLEQEELERRHFRAQPIYCNGPVFIPERSRKPLTEIQEFSFHADSRAVERAEFDRKVIEKQNHYKQFREELEAARKVEEDKLIKALRKEMIPQARPMPIFGKPFVPQRSTREPTRAVSPQLRVLARKERRQSTVQRQSLERRRSLDRRRSSVLNVEKRTQLR